MKVNENNTCDYYTPSSRLNSSTSQSLLIPHPCQSLGNSTLAAHTTAAGYPALIEQIGKR